MAFTRSMADRFRDMGLNVTNFLRDRTLNNSNNNEEGRGGPLPGNGLNQQNPENLGMNFDHQQHLYASNLPNQNLETSRSISITQDIPQSSVTTTAHQQMGCIPKRPLQSNPHASVIASTQQQVSDRSNSPLQGNQQISNVSVQHTALNNMTNLTSHADPRFSVNTGFQHVNMPLSSTEHQQVTGATHQIIIDQALVHAPPTVNHVTMNQVNAQLSANNNVTSLSSPISRTNNIQYASGLQSHYQPSAPPLNDFSSSANFVWDNEFGTQTNISPRVIHDESVSHNPLTETPRSHRRVSMQDRFSHALNSLDFMSNRNLRDSYVSIDSEPTSPLENDHLTGIPNPVDWMRKNFNLFRDKRAASTPHPDSLQTNPSLTLRNQQIRQNVQVSSVHHQTVPQNITNIDSGTHVQNNRIMNTQTIPTPVTTSPPVQSLPGNNVTSCYQPPPFSSYNQPQTVGNLQTSTQSISCHHNALSIHQPAPNLTPYAPNYPQPPISYDPHTISLHQNPPIHPPRSQPNSNLVQTSVPYLTQVSQVCPLPPNLNVSSQSYIPPVQPMYPNNVSHAQTSQHMTPSHHPQQSLADTYCIPPTMNIPQSNINLTQTIVPTSYDNNNRHQMHNEPNYSSYNIQYNHNNSRPDLPR